MRSLKLAAALSALFAGGSASAQSFVDVTPASAIATIVIPNVEKLVASAEEFAQGAGLPSQRPDLSQVTQFMGDVGSAWKLDRGLAIVIFEPGEEGVAALIPVDDAEATLKKAEAKVTDGVGEITLAGQTVSAAPLGKFIALSRSAATVKRFAGSEPKAGAALRATSKDMLAKGNVFVHVGSAALKKFYDQVKENEQFKKNMKEGIEKTSKRIPNAPPPEVIEAQIEKGIEALEKNFNGIIGSLTLDRNMAHLQIGLETKEGTPAAQRLAAFQPPTADFFAGQPNGNVVAALAINGAALPQNGDQAKAVGVGTINLGLYFHDALSVALKVGAVNAGMIDSQLKGLMALAPAFAGSLPMIELQPGNQKIGGADVTQLTLVGKNQPENSKKAMTLLLGGETLYVQEGLVGNSVGIAVTGKPEGFTMLQTNGSYGQSDKLKATMALLPANSLAVAVIDPIVGLRLAQKAEGLTGRSHFEGRTIPAGLGTPVGAAIATTADAAIFHLVAPSASIKEALPVFRADH